MWRVIDNCIGRSWLSVPCFSNMTADDLNNVFVNLAPNTIKKFRLEIVSVSICVNEFYHRFILHL